MPLTKRIPPEERFWAKVRKTETCWLWTASTNQAGYGHFQPGHGSPDIAAHRFAYKLLVGPIPEGHQLHHECRVPACVNPAHLRAVTPREHNVNFTVGSPAYRLSRLTHCKRGHPFSEANTYICSKGRRHCKACNAARERAYRAGEKHFGSPQGSHLKSPDRAVCLERG